MSAAKRDISKPKHSVHIPPPKEKQKEQEAGATSKQLWEESFRRSAEYCQLSFRRIPHWLRDTLKEIANEHQVPMEQVGRLFLERAAEAYQNGQISIEPILESGRLKIFPDWE